jgi:hypothetical protein
MILKRIGPFSVAKIGGIIYAVLGFVVGIFVSFFAMLGVFANAMTSDGPGALFGIFFGVGAIIFLPICYGLLGFVMCAITAWLYNIFAGVVGGIEVDLQ